ncbi:monocarboxylate transporter 4-like isoform X2 [Scylla paramamosain]|uniref:monocarboxylate transporter 4-like isoform X2 n=1 Tax=Scylla paramamosain TaxID=85552 RepID=UPI003083505A
MDKDLEAALLLHEDANAIQSWKQEKELEHKEDDQEDDEEEDEEYYEALSWEGNNWPVVLAGFVINMLSPVGNNCFGMLFLPRLLELGLPPWLVTALGNVSLAVANLICLSATPLLHRWGCRRLLLLLGFVYSTAFTLAALAFSMPGPLAATAIVAGSLRELVFLVVQVAVSRCFERKRPLAIGVTAAGTSLNQIMGPPMIAFMQSRYSPRTMLLVISVLMLQICIAASLMPSGRGRGALLPVDHLAMVRRREVVLLCLVIAVISATMSVFWFTIPLALLSTGHNSREMVPYFSIPGVANFITRVVIGLLLCHLCRPTPLMKLCSTLSAVTISVWFWCERPFWRIVWLSLCGGCSGVTRVLISLVVLEAVGLQWQAEALSLISVTTGFATLLVGEVADLSRVLTGSYASKMYAMSAFLMLTQVLWEFVDVRASEPSSTHQRREKKPTDCR